jgi:outer membrane protein TolC
MGTAREALLAIARTGDKPHFDFRGDWGLKDFTVQNPNVAENGDISPGGTVWNAWIYFSFPFFDGMRTRRQVMQARGNLARAPRDYLVARINLDYVMGVLGEPAPPAS